MPDEAIIIDGSQGEGGGQMLRTSLAFSAITGKPLIIKNIRANRPKPGLARQHLAGLELIGKICNAKIMGAEMGSTNVEFTPGQIEHSQYTIDVGTAGSITLVLQTILPALATVKGESEIQLMGGTDVKWSPPADYYTLVLFPLLKKIGLECTLDIEQRGYFPRGGGKVTARIVSNGELKPLEIEKYSDGKITGILNITDLPVKIAEQIKNTVLETFPDAEIQIQKREKGPSPGVGIVLSANSGQTILGASSLGERGKPAQKVGKEAAENLLIEMNRQGSSDVFASDQILPYLAMAGGSISSREYTSHARTNIETIEKFLGKTFKIEEGQIMKFTSRPSSTFGTTLNQA